LAIIGGMTFLVSFQGSNKGVACTDSTRTLEQRSTATGPTNKEQSKSEAARTTLVLVPKFLPSKVTLSLRNVFGALITATPGHEQDQKTNAEKLRFLR
jgi:hypothetical protein